MNISEQIKYLKRFSEAQCNEILAHIDENGIDLATCCQQAKCILIGAIKSNTFHSCGFHQVLKYLEETFQWGVMKPKYFCECVTHRFELDCSVRTSLAIHMLHHFQDLTKSQQILSFLSVEMIMRCNPLDYNIWHDMMKAKRIAFSNKDWLMKDVLYHKCIGIYNQITNNIEIWDHGKWIPFKFSNNDESSIISIRISTAGEDDDEKEVLWDHQYKVKLNRWNDLPKSLPSHSIRQLRPLQSVYDHKSFLSINDVPTAAQIVFISGLIMSNNPCSGAGVARSIRYQYPKLVMIAFDQSIENPDMSAATDPVFSCSYTPTNITHDKHQKEKQFLHVLELLEKYHNAVYIPCMDSDVAMIAEAMEMMTAHLNDNSSTYSQANQAIPSKIGIVMKSLKRTDETIASITARILCPSRTTIEGTYKPAIHAVTKSILNSYFTIPKSFSIENTASLTDIKMLCDGIGYPVVVKGNDKGAFICHSWLQVTSCLYPQSKELSSNFIQEYIVGKEICVAFCAYSGQLLGCCTMIKAAHTFEGKAWSGDLVPTDALLVNLLRQYVLDSNWTGGGEIEFINDSFGINYVIDINPRFPAWIFACTYAELNLPGLLIQASFGENMAALLTVPFPVSFVRTMIEIPRMHVAGHRSIQNVIAGTNIIKMKAGTSLPRDQNQHMKVLLSVIPRLNFMTDCGFKHHFESQIKDVGRVQSDIATIMHGPTTNRAMISESIQYRYVADMANLCTAANEILRATNSRGLHTPRFIFSISNARQSLLRHQDLIRRIQNLEEQATVVPFQMCLSIKTQPLSQLISLARELQYNAECINMSEVHKCLSCGYQLDQIVLTGPAKWWDHSHRPLSELPREQQFHAIFADSLEDLKDLINKLHHPHTPIRASVVGIRWSPCSLTTSRFGFDPSNYEVVKDASILVRKFPAHVKLGMHFHHAPSTLGGRAWMGLLNGFISFCQEFSVLCKKPLEIIDFGGGWAPHFFEHDFIQDEFIKLFGHIRKCFSNSTVENDSLMCINTVVNNNFDENQDFSTNHISEMRFPVVQFELGKSISENSGAVITRILGFKRIVNHYNVVEEQQPDCSRSPDFSNGNICKNGKHKRKFVGGENSCYASKEMVEDDDLYEASIPHDNFASYAIIVDACHGDLTSPHIHPVFWLSSSIIRRLKSASVTVNVNDNEISASLSEWIPLELGENPIWGRTCMEFDRPTNLSVTMLTGMKIGDYLLIGACGAYDMSMHYEFGNAKERDIEVIV